MRRSASEIISELENRIAHLEKQSYGKSKAINLDLIDRSGKSLKHLIEVMSEWISTSTSLKREVDELFDFYLNRDKIFFDKEDFRLDIECVIEYFENEGDEDTKESLKHFTIYLHDHHRGGPNEISDAIMNLEVRDIDEEYSGFDD